MISKRLIIALDTDDFNLVKKLSAFFDPKLCLMKVGLQLYIAHGKEVLDYLSEQGFEIFLDNLVQFKESNIKINKIFLFVFFSILFLLI